jgi:hypothetical protein
MASLFRDGFARGAVILAAFKRQSNEDWQRRSFRRFATYRQRRMAARKPAPLPGAR